MSRLRYTRRLLAGGMGGYLCAQLSLLAVSAMRGAVNARESAPFSRSVPRVTDSAPRVLVIGDSTGVGVGAGDAGNSFAGLLSRDFADAIVDNRSVNGAKLADALRQFEACGPGDGELPRYDLVLVHAGGNDLIRTLSMRRMLVDADALLLALRQRAAHVVWFGSANIGLSRLFLPPFGLLMSARVRHAHVAFRKLADRHGATFVDYFREAGCDPYSSRPERFYANDQVHPSRAAYRYCYQVLRRRVPLDRWLARGLTAPVVIRVASRLVTRRH